MEAGPRFAVPAERVPTFWSATSLTETKETPMGSLDEVKGRLKEAVGALSGSKDLKRSGKADQVAGKTKDAIDAVRKKASEAVDSINDRTPKS